MGFDDVYLLDGGRAAWTVMGLPTEGQVGDSRRIVRFLHEVPAVDVDATVADVKKIGDIRYTVAVLGRDDVVVGGLRPSVRALRSSTRVRDIMIPAPSTIRPDLRVDEVAQQLADDGLDHVLVTTVNGVLLGMVAVEGLHV
jgi:CBS-domain-containing membrane protein